ncbi:RagB/SusD family nutrient uptake outer membrane protein [uncultured Algibacter sp.]|uniref:RagB/SusD family nutrient uptake outer membrane protein n=1 Tax=uncultured Algibacter sp. TaxID=298659 RepID=UPI00260F0721|nr:RagB/SusD family nutrient uptake outer membrane protein [uncultured Algibacter sp.]
MKKYIKTQCAKLTTLFVLSMSLAFFGCKDEFLEQTNPNEISTATFWSNLDDLDKGLTATYKGLAGGSNFRLVDEMLRSDIAWGTGYQRPNNVNPYYLQIFNEADQAPNGKWSALYTTIFRANQVIRGAEGLLGTFETEDDEEEAIVMYAQARFIRGFAYFMLHNSFNNGSVPLLDFVPETESEFYNALQPAETVRDFYLEDLDFAQNNLPTSWEDPRDLGRVTAGAAVAVIGQSYLFAGNFSEAAIHFKRLIDDFDYALAPNIGSNFTTMDEFNQESILEINYTMNFKNELGPWDGRDTANTASLQKLLTGGPGAWWGGVLANWLILEYRNEKIDFTDARNIVVDEDGNESFRKFSLRTSWSVALVDDEDMPYYGGDITGQGSNFNVRMSAFWRKHTNWDLGEKDEDAISPGKVRSAINERLIRLAQIYLQYAECMIEQGNIDEALLYINKVRRRSAVQLLGPNGSGEFPTNDHDNITYNAQTLMEHLRYKEYPLELSCEGYGGVRNIDLRRWGVKKQRFQELAQKRYHGLHHSLVLQDGKRVTRWESIVEELPPDDPKVNEGWNEFIEASQNYNDASHAYWPIPNGEIIANPKLYD